MNIPISCTIITYNEEANIERCLNAVSWCNEIVVVDSGSTDKTLEICNKFGCKIHHKDFKGFGEQKRFAVSLAENNWVLNVDADEVVSEELKNEIISIFNKDNINVNGFYLARSLFFLGKRFKYGRESKEFFIRLFNKKYGDFTEEKVHEKVLVNGATAKLNNAILHYSYTSVHQYFEKFNLYTTEAAKILFDKGKNRSLFLTIIFFPLYFIKNYFVNRNFLNGVQGLMWAFFSSCYPVVKYAKLWSFTEG